MTALNITAPEFIDRQHRMNIAKCGVSPAAIDRMMKLENEKLLDLIAQGRKAVLSLTGDRLAAAEGALRAMVIEADLRGITA